MRLSLKELGRNEKVRTMNKRERFSQKGAAGCSTSGKAPRSSFLQLAARRKFDEIERILRSAEDVDAKEWLCGGSSGRETLAKFKGQTPLHTIMEYHPTAAVVGLICKKMTAHHDDSFIPESALDMRGRTPLHLAAARGCDVQIIERLMHGSLSVIPALTKDSSHRVPLHYACSGEVGSSKAKGKRSKECIENAVNIVERLLEAYPESVAVKDKDGRTPLDLALESKVDFRILKALGETEVTTKSRRTMDTSYTHTEVSHSYDFDDDVSSVGSGGVSRYLGRSNSKHTSERLDL